MKSRPSLMGPDLRAIESVVGPLSDATRMVINTGQAARLEAALGLPPGRLTNGGIISIIEDIAARNPRGVTSGNPLFLGVGKGLPGGGPELEIAPISTAGGGGIRQVILTVR
jgi:hypothetical protein